MSERESALTVALRYVFAPLVKQSTRWPAPLAYGLPAVIAVLLIALGRTTLPSNLAWLTAIVVLAPLAAYLFTDWDARRHSRPVTITGNVLFEHGLPVKGALVFVDGVDRKKETDETGWFQIVVDARSSWTVRAQHQSRVAQRTLSNEDALHSVVLVLPDTVVSQQGDRATAANDTASLLRLVPRSGSEGPGFESRQRLTTIGRSPKSTICLTHSTVSWEHAQIVLMSDGYHYRHVGSNPTVLRRRGEEWALRQGVRDDILLHTGDRLIIGTATYVVELNFDAGDTGTGYLTTAPKAEETP